MGLMTLLLLLAFTLLYLNKALVLNHELLRRVADKVAEDLDRMALWGAIYAVAAIFLVLIVPYNTGDVIIRLIANMMIVVMALPYMFEKVVIRYQANIPAKAVDETRKIAGMVTTQGKYFGYAGFIISLLLFAVLFR